MRTRNIIIIASATAVVGLGASAAAVAARSTDDERPITGEALDTASTAALAHVGGGRVTETEVGDEDSYYEVEVTLEDGRQIDVQLDADFAVVGDEPDTDSADDEATESGS